MKVVSPVLPRIVSEQEVLGNSTYLSPSATAK